MRNSVIARRYARALFELSCERDILESVKNEVASFASNMQSTPGFRQFLVSQDLTKNAKKAKLEMVFQNRVSNVFFNFLLVLLRKNRESIFSDIAREFGQMVDRHQKRTRAAAITAVPLDKKSTSKLKSILDKSLGVDVRINNKIDKSILGGIIVSVDGRIWDGSLQSQLQRLKTQLVENRNSN